MKKNVLILTAAVAITLALAGCQRENSATAEGHPEKIVLRFENIRNPKTRLDVDGTTGAGTWTTGDRIAVYISGKGANFYQITPLENISGNEGHAEVYLAGGQIRDNYAVYPASVAVQGHGTSADDLYIRYPDSYDFLDMTPAEMATYTPSPMVAVNTDHQDLHFFHVGGILRLTIPNVPMAITQLRIIFPDEIQYTGTFKVNIPATGLDDATLTPVDGGESDDHGHVITIQLPVIETLVADLTFNIPIPNGTVSPEARNYRVEAYSGDTLIAKTDETMNWWEFQRAEGRQVTLPPLEGYGTMAGRYIARGTYLARANQSSTALEDMYLATVDDLEPICHYGLADGRTHYFNCNEIFTLFGTSNGCVGKTITINGGTYMIASSNDWNYIVNGPRYGSTVNGTPGVRYAKIKVNVSPLNGVRINNNSVFYNADVNGLLLFPDFGTYTVEGLTTFNTSDAGFEPTLSYVQMRKLCSGETDCIFLPCAGWYDNSNFAEGNTLGAYKYSDGQYNAFAPSLRITASAVNASNSLANQYRGPVRLLRVQ